MLLQYCYCKHADLHAPAAAQVTYHEHATYGTYWALRLMKLGRRGLDKAPGVQDPLFFPALLQCGTELWGLLLCVELMGSLLARSVAHFG